MSRCIELEPTVSDAVVASTLRGRTFCHLSDGFFTPAWRYVARATWRSGRAMLGPAPSTRERTKRRLACWSQREPPMLATSLPPISLSLAGRAGYRFTPPTVIDGFACHARGVEIISSSSSYVRARVRSKRAYEIALTAVEKKLLIDCQCPARSLGLDVCKHAWAALLEIDRRGGLEDLKDVGSALIVEMHSTSPKVTSASSPGEVASSVRTPSASTAGSSREPCGSEDLSGSSVKPTSATTVRTPRRREKDSVSPLPARANTQQTKSFPVSSRTAKTNKTPDFKSPDLGKDVAADRHTSRATAQERRRSISVGGSAKPSDARHPPTPIVRAQKRSASTAKSKRSR